MVGAAFYTHAQPNTYLSELGDANLASEQDTARFGDHRQTGVTTGFTVPVLARG